MIVLGTSAGGLKALQTVLAGLPSTFPLPIAMVVHRYRDSDDTLQTALQRHCALPVIEVEDKMPIQPGHVFVAPADYHLLVAPDYFSLSIDEPVTYARPSVDVLFESAADVFEKRAVGVILTGLGQDGARGAAEIMNKGGKIIVQDPATAEYPMMPAATLAATRTPFLKPLNLIAPAMLAFAQP